MGMGAGLKKFLYDTPKQSLRFLKDDWPRMGWVLLIAGTALLVYEFTDSEELAKVSLHVVIELLGAILVLVLLEKNIERVAELRYARIRDVEKFKPDDFINRIDNASEIRILDFSLFTLFHYSEYRTKIEDAILKSKKTKVVILLARPDSEESIKRAGILAKQGICPIDIAGSTESLFVFLDKLKREIGDTEFTSRIHVGFFEGHPGFAMYQAGDGAFVSFYTDYRLTMGQPQLFIPFDTDVGRFFDDTFKEKERGATPARNLKDVKEYLEKFKDKSY